MNLRFGIVGVGYFGKHYVRLLENMPGVELVGATRISKDIGPLSRPIKTYATPDELFADDSIECIVIASPPSTHAALAVLALERGKHVLLEKPMAISLPEAELIAEAAARSGRICMIGHQYCYNDYIRTLKQEMDRGSIGDVRYVFAQHVYPGPVRRDVGCLWETATHELSVLDFLFPERHPSSISGKMVDIAETGRDDATTVVLTYPHGLVATIFVSWFAPHKVRTMVIGGTSGMALFDEKNSSPLSLYPRPYPNHVRIGAGPYAFTQDEIHIPRIQAGEPLGNQLDHFVDCVRTNSVPLTGVDHGLRVTRLLDEITTRLKNN